MAQLTTSALMSRLAYGELLNIKMGDLGDGTIRPENHPQVLVQLNKALVDIFTRFLLSSKEVVLNTNINSTHYYLRYDFALSNVASLQPVRYIDDTLCEGFDGRIAKILSVYDAFGSQLFMNKAQEPMSVFTPQHDCLQISANHQTEQFFVIFQALHPIITLEPDSVVNIPPALEEPLLLLAASKIYGSMNGPAHVAKSAMLDQDYERKLLISEIKDTSSTSENMSNSKLERSGFV